MKTIAYILFGLTLSLLPLALIAQSDDGFSSFEERMTGREFTEAGLHKLSEEELAALNEWVRQRSLAEHEQAQIAAAVQSAAGVSDINNMPREIIVSSIVGSFSGWDGNTEFVLENGMVWEQAGSDDTFATRRLENPIVTIRPALFGSWTLQVEGYNRRTRVRRIE